MGPGGRAICWLWMRSLSLRLGGRRWRRWLVLGFMVRISRTTEPGCNIERAYCCSAHGEHCQSAKKVFRVLLLPFSAHAFIHDLGSSQDPSLISTSIIHHFPSPIPPPSSSPPHKKHLLRLPPRQRLNTIHHILESLLIFPRRSLRPLHLPSIIPLDLKRRQHNPRIEPIDILLRVCGETFELLDEGEELVDVVAA